MTVSTTTERLNEAIDILESSIRSAQERLNDRGDTSSQVSFRFDGYLATTATLREQSAKLSDSINNGEWEQVYQIVNLLRSSLQLIQTDVCQVMQELTAAPGTPRLREYQA
jgi:hypothetical protein